MCIRKWLKNIWDRLIDFWSPATINRIYRFFHLIHRSLQFLKSLIFGRFSYILLLLFSTVLFIWLIALRTGLTVQQNITSTGGGIVSSNHSANLTSILSQSSTFQGVDWSTVISWTGLAQIFAIYLIFLVITWIFRYHSTLVIEEFSDDTGNDEKNKITGIDTFLLVKLRRITQLYSDVNEQRPISTSIGEYREISAVLKVDDPGDLLVKAESTTSTISFGPVAIPIGLFISLFNNLSRGPRIRGSIRKTENGYILLASMSGIGHNFAWKIERNLKKSKKNGNLDNEITEENKSDTSFDKCPVEEMVKELAYRIYTDIPSTGSFNWKATCKFNNGLTSYRECLKTPKDQIKNLKKAENNFQKALAYDNTFSTAWYNLGVVYSELKMGTAAEKAFLKAIEQDQNQPKAYYALAQTRYRRLFWYRDKRVSEYKKNILDCCNQVSSLNSKICLPFTKTIYRIRNWDFPDFYSLEARNLNLKGMTYLEMSFHETENKSDLIKKAILCQKKALVLAWVNYSQISHIGIDRDNYIKNNWENSCRLLATCMSDLAWAYLYMFNFPEKDSNNKIISDDSCKKQKYLKKSVYLLKQSININHKMNSQCICPELHWRLGVAYCLHRDFTAKINFEKACEEFTNSIRINPEITKYYISLAHASHLSGNEKLLNKTCISTGLEYAIKSYYEETESNGDQWRTLEQFFELTRNSSRDKTKANKNSCYQCFKVLHYFLRDLHKQNKLLDFYEDTDEIELKYKINKILLTYSVYMIYEYLYKPKKNCENTQESQNNQCMHCTQNLFIILKWMLGHISITTGRYYYFKASLLTSQLNKNTDIEILYEKSKKYFECSYDFFELFPKERSKINTYISLVETTGISKDIPDALFNISSTHNLNPSDNFIHMVQGTIGIETENYCKSLDYFDEALWRAYNISNFSQYIINKYFKRIAYSHIHIADFCIDDKKKNKHYETALESLEKSRRIFSAAYNQHLKPEDELYGYNLKSTDIKKQQASKIFRSIIASYFWTGLIFLQKQKYEKANYYFNLVNSYYKPEPHRETNITENYSVWEGFEEYIITLFMLSDSYSQMTEYLTVRYYCDEILDYEKSLKKISPDRYIGEEIWFIIHPHVIMISTYLKKVRLSVDLHIYQEGITKWLNEAKDYLTRFNSLYMQNMQQDIQKEKQIFIMKMNITKYYGELNKCRGLVALKFNIINQENMPSEETEKESPRPVSKESLKYAIESFKKAIISCPEPESYFFLLNAVEKLIDLEGKKLQKDEKEELIHTAYEYSESLKKIDKKSSHKEFIASFDEKIKEFSKPEKTEEKQKIYVLKQKTQPANIIINSQTAEKIADFSKKKEHK